MGYDEENNQLLLKVNGADTVIPFNSGLITAELLSLLADGTKYFCIITSRSSGVYVDFKSGSSITSNRVYYNQTSASGYFISEGCDSNNGNWWAKTLRSNFRVVGILNYEEFDETFPTAGSYIFEGQSLQTGTFLICYEV